jgi:3-hydroxybutyryl-CoA dehydrogenase
MDKSSLGTIGVLGAGAMGSGVAQVAAASGHKVILFDTNGDALLRAQALITKNLRREIEKGRLDDKQAQAIQERVTFLDGNRADPLKPFERATLVIEAVIENLEIKQEIFQRLEAAVSADCLLATNTSSLSVTSIASACKMPERTLGIHFFNPVPAMPLVEIIPGIATSPRTVETATTLITSWGKTTVLAKDTPGFIVNRIARPFYGESIRILEEGIADVATIDWALKEIGGFRMGPFELMDFIGNDVNYTVTQTVYEAFFYDPRFKPSLTQKRLVEARFLGRKSGRGYYDYRPGAEQLEPVRDRAVGEAIVRRIVAMLINEAADAVFMRIASPADIELAMTKGVNYPRGLLAWAEELGLSAVLKTLVELHEEYGEDRYRPNPLLRRLAKAKGSFLKRGV